MKTYQFSNPPKKAGIYILKNKLTGMRYVGKSVNLYRRYSEWKMVFAQKIGIRSNKFLEILDDSSPDHWEFVILAEFDEIDEDSLNTIENEAIAKLSAQDPELLLNSHMAVTTSNEKIKPGTRSVILDRGVPIPFSEAARVLGCTTKQVQRRMARYRQKGVQTMTLDELKVLTAKFRPPTP